MTNNWCDFFPFICCDTFSQETRDKIDKYVKDIVPHHKRTEQNRPEHLRRSDHAIAIHSRYGIKKEIAYAMIQGLSMDYVHFHVTDKADKYDIKVDEFTKVDVTTADVEKFEMNKDGTFGLLFSITSQKLDSIMNRPKESYEANKIAFLKETGGKIYFLGQIRKNNLLHKYNTEKYNTYNNTHGQKRYSFHTKVIKRSLNYILENEIILD